MDIAALSAKTAAIGNVPVDFSKALHVDADYAAYYFSGSDSTSLPEAQLAMRSALASVQDVTGCGRVVLHLTTAGSDKGGRYKIATVKPYQGQRNSGRKPKNWAGMRAWLDSEAGARELGASTSHWECREADDGCALAARTEGGIIYLLTRDKDFRMIPGQHVVWTTHALVDVPENSFEVIGPDGLVYGHKWFWLQMLQGDTADNIPGLEKHWAANGKLKLCGEKTAQALLADCKCNDDAFDVVYNHYVGYYGAEGADRFAEQAALLWMRNDVAASPVNYMQVVSTPPAALVAANIALLDKVKSIDNPANS